MSRGAKFLIIVMGCLLMGATSVSAQSGSTVVTAAIAPVRIIVVDDHGKITQVISNTPDTMTPTVRKGTPEGHQVGLTRDIKAQYADILKRTDTRKTGVIYRANNGMGMRISLISYLFLYSRS